MLYTVSKKVLALISLSENLLSNNFLKGELLILMIEVLIKLIFDELKWYTPSVFECEFDVVLLDGKLTNLYLILDFPQKWHKNFPSVGIGP